MRAHNSEHRDSLPVLDVTALRHVAFVLDAIIFYMRASNELDCERNDSNAWDDQDDNENDDVDDEFASSIVMDTDSIDENDMVRPTLGKRHSFFQRSESTLCLGCPAPDPFNTPMTEALPLAEQPQLLQPNARREDLFGMPKQAITVPADHANASSSLELPPIKLGLSAQSKDVLQNSANNTTNTVVISVNPAASSASSSSSADSHHADALVGGVSDEKASSQVLSITKDVSSILKRSHSPQPGSSKQKATICQYTAQAYSDESDSGDDEPQNLSTKSKIDELKMAEKHLYEDSEDSDNESGLRSPVAKKHRLMENETIHSADGGFSMIPVSRSSKSPSDQDSIDQSNRPPIIVVTRSNVADAIENAVANVLSKNKKQSLNECATPETPINFLPSNFVYEADGKPREHDPQSVNKSSVIVRVGPSVS
jgi:hypothetical protein